MILYNNFTWISLSLSAFTMMIILALIRIGKGHSEGHPTMAQISGVPNLFGVCVYSFMCQHSLPSLVTPISNKQRMSALVMADYILILCFYSLLSLTAIFCFDSSLLRDMYTLNFTDNCDVLSIPVLRYFLGLFPVFTISTNFPILPSRYANNWKTSLPSGRRHVPLGGGPYRLPAHYSSAAHYRGLLYSRSRGTCGYHRGVCRNRHSVYHPGLPSSIF